MPLGCDCSDRYARTAHAVLNGGRCMPACIRVESGIAAGTSVWIDRPVLRIGSDPQCEICLPSAELPSHAVTLEFRNGNYRAYNRGSSTLVIGPEVIPPGGHLVWQPHQSMNLPGDLRLSLEVDGDPRPSPRPEALAADSVIGVEETMAISGEVSEAPSKKSSGTMIQLGVIGFCVLAMGAFLTMNRGDDTAAADRPTFDAIVKSSLAASENSVAKRLLPRLQFAQSAVVRGNVKLANERFSALRDRLILQIESLRGDDRKQAEMVLDYVEYQLGRLN